MEEDIEKEVFDKKKKKSNVVKLIRPYKRLLAEEVDREISEFCKKTGILKYKFLLFLFLNFLKEKEDFFREYYKNNPEKLKKIDELLQSYETMKKFWFKSLE